MDFRALKNAAFSRCHHPHLSFIYSLLFTQTAWYIQIKPTLFTTLLLICSSYFLNVKRKDHILGTQDVAAEAGNCGWQKSERNLHGSQTALDWLNVSSERHTSQCYLEDNDYTPQEFRQHSFFLFICLLFPSQVFQTDPFSKLRTGFSCCLGLWQIRK